MKIQPSILFTQKGYEDLLSEEKTLKAERPAVVEDLSRARAMGDLSENGYYKSARFKLFQVDRRLRELSHLIRYAKVREKTFSDTIDIDSRVTLTGETGEKVYTIVGGYESNPSLGKLSHMSPLGKMLMGKKKGEKVTIVAPRGTQSYVIEKIE